MQSFFWSITAPVSVSGLPFFEADQLSIAKNRDSQCVWCIAQAFRLIRGSIGPVREQYHIDCNAPISRAIRACLGELLRRTKAHFQRQEQVLTDPPNHQLFEYPGRPGRGLGQAIGTSAFITFPRASSRSV